MFGLNWKPLLIGAVVAVTLAMGASQADACWRCGWSYGGCYGYATYYTPCYTSYSTVGCDPCYSTGCGWYVGYRPGPIRRLLFGPYRYYYGGGYYSSCYWDTCCTVGTAAPSAPSQPAPTEAQKPALPGEPAGPAAPPPETPDKPEPGGDPPAAAPGPPADTTPSTFHTPANSGLLTIYVPYGAKVKVNGRTTRSEGSRRQFVSYGLKPGFNYKYVVRAQAMARVRENPEDPYSPLVNRLVEKEKVVVLTAGDRKMVTFGFNPAPGPGLASR